MKMLRIFGFILLFGGLLDLSYYLYSSQNPEIVKSKFSQLVEKEEFVKAATYIKDLPQDQDDQTLYKISLTYFNLGDFDQAKTSIKKALTLHPEEPDYLNFYGNILRESKEYGQAISFYQKAIEADPNFSQAKANLSLTYQLKESGEKDKI